MDPFTTTLLVILCLGIIAYLVRLAHGPGRRDRFAALLGVGQLVTGALVVFAAATQRNAFFHIALIWLCVLAAGSLQLARLYREEPPDD
jgi:multisubunit Na+/H+ antiporter MnhF subunit